MSRKLQIPRKASSSARSFILEVRAENVIERKNAATKHGMTQRWRCTHNFTNSDVPFPQGDPQITAKELADLFEQYAVSHNGEPTVFF
jgi:hypothetical protein